MPVLNPNGQNFVHNAMWPLLLMQRGTINALCFSHCGKFLMAGVGKEHRLGRWWSDKEAKNIIALVPLDKTPLGHTTT